MSSTVGARYKTGTVVATAAALEVRSMGWKPAKVIVTNETSLYRAVHTKGMDDDSAFEITNLGAMTLEMSDLITLEDADSSGNPGFSLGTRANINDAAGEVLRWEAWEDTADAGV